MRKAVLMSACTGLIVLGSIGAATAQSSGGMNRPAAPASQSKVTGAASSPSDAMAMTKKKAKKAKAKKASPASAAPAQTAPPKSSY